MNRLFASLLALSFGMIGIVSAAYIGISGINFDLPEAAVLLIASILLIDIAFSTARIE